MQELRPVSGLSLHKLPKTGYFRLIPQYEKDEYGGTQASMKRVSQEAPAFLKKRASNLRAGTGTKLIWSSTSPSYRRYETRNFSESRSFGLVDSFDL